MKTRVIAGFAMLPLLFLVYGGGYVLMFGTAVVTAVALNEFFRGLEGMGLKPSRPIGFGSLILLYCAHIICPGISTLTGLWVVICVAAAGIYIFNTKDRGPEDAMATVLGILYIEFFFYHVVLVDNTAYPILRWMIFITAFCTDICAYFTGYLLGKHKMCPGLSPNKTWEGAIGGTLGTGIISAVFGYVFFRARWILIFILGIAAAVAAQFGDLTASAFKRKMGIKDYGNLIPGHGGIMDRFDSVIFTAPTIYYFIIFILKG